MTTMQGRIVSISLDPMGSSVLEPAGVGEDEIVVMDSSDFDPNGNCLIGEDIYVISAIVEDEDFDTITVTPPLLVAVDEETMVLAYPTGDDISCTVAIGEDNSDSDDTGENLTAILSHNLKALDPQDGWFVTVDDVSGQWMVTEVYSQSVGISGGAVSSPIPTEWVTDGLPPEGIVTPTGISGLSSIFVKIDGITNPDPVQYEYHISDTSGFIPVPGDQATVLMMAASTLISSRTLSSGTPLEYDKEYYVRVIPKDADGYGTAGPEAVVMMSQVGAIDIIANSISAEQMSSIITLSMLFRTAEVGERVEIGTEGGTGFQGIRIYDSTGAMVINLTPQEAMFAGNVIAKHLESLGATLNGVTEGAPGGTFELQASIIEGPGFIPSISAVPNSTLEVKTTNPIPFPPTAYCKMPDSNRIMAVIPAPDPSGGANLYFINATTGLEEGVGAVVRTSGSIFQPIGFATKPGLILGWGRNATTGQKVQGFWTTNGSDGISGAAANFAGFTEPAAPGVGGYRQSEPVYGLSQSGLYLIAAHRVIGDQTIDGKDYLDKEVMIRVFQFFSTVPGPPIPLFLIRTIRTALYPNELESVLCNNPQAAGSFDLPTTASRAGYCISGSGIGAFGAANWILEAPITGTTADANIPAAGPTSWYGGGGEAMYIGGTWYGVQVFNRKFIDKFNNSNEASAPAYFAYTYYKTAGNQESKMSPVAMNYLFKRFKQNWTIPALPEGVTQVRLYVSRDTNRANFERFDTKTGTAGQPLAFSVTPPVPPGGAAVAPPPVSSTFVSPGSPYEIYSKIGGFRVTGEGKGAWPYIMPPGTVLEHCGIRTPDGFLPALGAAFLRADYPDLAQECSPNLGSATFTASSQNITIPSHGLPHGIKVMFWTPGTIPTGVGQTTTYWASVMDANTIRISSSFANFVAATFITPSTAGSGTITAWAIPFGNPGNTTAFYVPNRGGRMAVGASAIDNDFTLGQTGGAKTVAISVAQMPSHNHGGATVANDVGAGNSATEAAGSTGTIYVRRATSSGAETSPAIFGSNHAHTINAQGGGAAHENMSPYTVANFIIKT